MLSQYVSHAVRLEWQSNCNYVSQHTKKPHFFLVSLPQISRVVLFAFYTLKLMEIHDVMIKAAQSSLLYTLL